VVDGLESVWVAVMSGWEQSRDDLQVARRMLTIVWKNFGRHRFAVDPKSDHGLAVRQAAVRGWAKRHGEGCYALTDAGVREALARGAGVE
jgi:hypothetical protein